MNPDPVLVIGVQRSGTTLLGRLLAANNDVYLTVNGKILYYLIVWIYRDPLISSSRHLRLDEIAYSLLRMPIIGAKESEILCMTKMLECNFRPEKFEGMQPKDIVRIIWSQIYENLSKGKTVVGDKYNEYLLQLPEIEQIFNNVQYIFLHRNPFEVGESMVRRFKGRPWSPTTFESALSKWTVWNMEWLKIRNKIDARRRIEISYHELIMNPKVVFASICDFLKIKRDDKYLEMVNAEIKNRTNSRILSTYNGKKQLKVDPSFHYVCEQLNYANKY